MANINNPSGFVPWGSDEESINPYINGSSALKRGDLVSLANGVLALFVPGTHKAPIGVLAEDCAANATGVRVYDDPDTTFLTQTADAYVSTTHDGTRCDFSGASGVQQATVTTNVFGALRVIRHVAGIIGSTEEGSYARILVKCAVHQKAAGAVTDEDFLAETISGTKTLTAASPKKYHVNGGGADRKVLMPAAGAAQRGDVRIIVNTGSTNAIVVRDSGDSATYKSLDPGMMVYAYCTGSQWAGL